MSRSQVDALCAVARELAEPLCIAEGMALVHVECGSEPQGQVLRMYIDKAGGVTLDDCINISRQVGDLIDVHSGNEHSYRLEVSSPGMDRPLGQPADYDRFSGQRARIQTDFPVNGKRKWTGVLAGIVDETVTLQVEDTSIAIPFSQITQARLIGYQGES